MKPKRPAASSLAGNLAAVLAPWRARWGALSPRERYLSSLAASAVGLLLVWAVALAPALATLQKVATRRAALDDQLQQMLALQAEARLLTAQPHIGRDTALRALQESVTGLGSGAQMQVSGERAVVTLKGVPAAGVATWLGQARTNARVVPLEARLVRSVARTPAAAAGGEARPPSVGAGADARMVAGLPLSGMPPAGTSMPASTAPTAAATLPGRPDDARWDGTVVLVLPAP